MTAANIDVTSLDAEIKGALALSGAPGLSFAQCDGGMTALKAGSLTLPASGVVRLSVSNPKAVRGLKARLIGCETVSGSVAGWSVDAPGYAPGVILSVESDGLYAEFRRLGSIMIVW